MPFNNENRSQQVSIFFNTKHEIYKQMLYYFRHDNLRGPQHSNHIIVQPPKAHSDTMRIVTTTPTMIGEIITTQINRSLTTITTTLTMIGGIITTPMNGISVTITGETTKEEVTLTIIKEVKVSWHIWDIQYIKLLQSKVLTMTRAQVLHC